MAPEGRSEWEGEWRKHMLGKIEELFAEIRRVTAAMADEVKSIRREEIYRMEQNFRSEIHRIEEKFNEKTNNLKIEVNTLQTKATILGAISGLVGTAAVTLIFKLLG